MTGAKLKLLSHCQKQPPIPVPRGVPPGTRFRHRFRDNETFESIARQYGVSEKQLLLHNFGTTKPEYLNWYLDEYVGCDLPTHDRKNWRFSSGASPGVIYIPGDNPDPVRVDVPAPPQPEDHPAGLRKSVSELMIYDADDQFSIDEAKQLLEDYQYGAWTVDIKGIRGVSELSGVLEQYINLEQVTFCTHGKSGSVYFRNGSLDLGTISSVVVPPTLFRGPGRLLFMGCETARPPNGELFLKRAGWQFFRGKGGTVGGATIYVRGYSWGSQLPLDGGSSDGREFGKLVIFRLDGKGQVIGSMTSQPGL
jgi:hypothetical protein